MLTGPTGCGKTRFVEHMGSLFGRPVVTISCHDDLTSSDLVGRFMVTGGDVIWTDGPLTRAVKAGAICYLDEVVEARHDSLAILHSVTDHRRALYLDRAGEVVRRRRRSCWCARTTLPTAAHSRSSSPHSGSALSHCRCTTFLPIGRPR